MTQNALSQGTLNDLHNYADELAQQGFVSIPEFLTKPFAEQLHQAIVSHKKWEMATLVEGKAFIAGVDEFNNLSAQKRASFIQQVIRYAADNDFQYVYDYVRLVGHNASYSDYLAPFVDFWQSSENLTLLSTLAGATSLLEIDAQLTRYAAGHFLKHHDDTGSYSGSTRKLAYVLNMTPTWRADHGGILHLQDEHWQIKQSFVPAYNTLIVFSVPTNHHVSQVANYCTRSRYSITGWLSASS